MAAENTAQFGTAFTVAIDARDGVTTGISAADRAHTIKAAIDPKTRPGDLAAGARFSRFALCRGSPSAGGTDGGLGGPVADGGALARGRHLRDHERGRHDGARAPAYVLCPPARAQDPDDQGPDPLPDPERAADPPRGGRGDSVGIRRFQTSCTRTTSTTTSTSLSSRGRSAGTSRTLVRSTPNVSRRRLRIASVRLR